MIVKLLDVIITQTGGIFGLAMNSLDCLLECGTFVVVVHLIIRHITYTLLDTTRNTVVEKLGSNFPYSKVSRLSRMLEVNGKENMY